MREPWLRRTVYLLSLLVVTLGACSRRPSQERGPSSELPTSSRLNEVLVLGMIHGSHRSSERYGLDVVRDIVRRVAPDYVLAEIPPGRLAPALESYRATGTVTEARVERFPEYTDAIIPLAVEQGFEIIPCAAWSREMADDRRAKLELWKTSRAAESLEVEQAQDLASARIKEAKLDLSPKGIHDSRYDELVKAGMEPYDRLFNEDLGPGGWTHINAAHFALIEEALDAHRGEGRRFLITFGAWHKYWFLEKLRERDDIRLLDPVDFMGE